MGKYFGILIIMAGILFGLEWFNVNSISYIDLPKSSSMYLFGAGIVAIVAFGRKKNGNTK